MATTAYQLPLFPSRLTPPPATALIQSYLQERLQKGEISSGSVPSLRRDLIILHQLAGTRPITHLSADEIKDMLSRLSQRSAPSTVHRRHGSWRAFYKWLLEKGYVTANPFDSIPHTTTRYREADIRFLEPAQAQTVLDLVASDPLINFVVRLVLATGIKRAELMRLRPMDFAWDQDQPMLHVSPETRRRRAVPLPTDLRPVYDTYIASLSSPLLPQERLITVSARCIENRLHRLSERSGLPFPLTLQVLRWTRAVWDLRAGVPEERVRAKLGMTSFYWRIVRLRLLPWVTHRAETQH